MSHVVEQDALAAEIINTLFTKLFQTSRLGTEKQFVDNKLTF